jgi:hypothetical protein
MSEIIWNVYIGFVWRCVTGKVRLIRACISSYSKLHEIKGNWGLLNLKSKYWNASDECPVLNFNNLSIYSRTQPSALSLINVVENGNSWTRYILNIRYRIWTHCSRRLVWHTEKYLYGFRYKPGFILRRFINLASFCAVVCENRNCSNFVLNRSLPCWL